MTSSPDSSSSSLNDPQVKVLTEPIEPKIEFPPNQTRFGSRIPLHQLASDQLIGTAFGHCQQVFGRMRDGRAHGWYPVDDIEYPSIRPIVSSAWRGAEPAEGTSRLHCWDILGVEFPCPGH